MKHFLHTFLTAAALASLVGLVATALPAHAQYGADVVPVYTTWQPLWERNQFDRRHVVLGVVSGFAPYRLTVQRPNGNVITIDLKNGTRIFPLDATPAQGQRVAVVGYWSNGTFIANRVVLRPASYVINEPVGAVAVMENGVPVYTTWQPAWDSNRFDQRHVVLGIVANFSPYRLTVQRPNGNVLTIDLKNGTRIFPTGATPTNGERAAVVGYWSNGTFIANRVVLRP